MGHPTEQDLAALRDWVSERYVSSGVAPDVVDALLRHNERVLEFTDQIADAADSTPQEHRLLRTIAVLHDAAKAEAPLLYHAEAAAELARAKLNEIGADPEFVETVVRAIRCHMGPLPFIEEEVRKHQARTRESLDIPAPQTRIEQLFYDADMLTLIDVTGVEKIVMLRSTVEQFIEEDRQAAEETGTTPLACAYASALQSVHRAAATLFSEAARSMADELVAEAERHVRDRVGTVADLPSS